MIDSDSDSDIEFIRSSGHSTRAEHQFKVDDSKQLAQNKSIYPTLNQSISLSVPEPTDLLTMSISKNQNPPLDPLAQANHSQILERIGELEVLRKYYADQIKEASRAKDWLAIGAAQTRIDKILKERQSLRNGTV